MDFGDFGPYIITNAVILALISATIWAYLGMKLYKEYKKKQRFREQQNTATIPLVNRNLNRRSLTSPMPSLTNTDVSSLEDVEHNGNVSNISTPSLTNLPSNITIEIVN